MNKRIRTILRGLILLGFVLAIGYVLYSNFSSEKGEIAIIGKKAPDFKLVTLEGDFVQLSELAGKGVFLNFWATYCPPCKKEMPFIENSYQYYKDTGVEVLAVDVGEPKLTVQSFVDQYNLTFPILLDKDEQVLNAYNIGPIPVTFLIDKDGIVIDKIVGEMTQQDVDNYMKRIQP
ncbi:thiol-disulfide oxidoreductase ResA [Bacillus sp. SCS-151]|uniref:thiol-disulfide oxidoreductase ResA n=1 Tax=Nanhaiella sioensis TaxID=3115293 RepID=UPI00397E1DE7